MGGFGVGESNERPGGGKSNFVPTLAEKANGLPSRGETLDGSIKTLGALADGFASKGNVENRLISMKSRLSFAVESKDLAKGETVARYTSKKGLLIGQRVASLVRFNAPVEAVSEVKFDLLAGILGQLSPERAKQIQSDEDLQKELMAMFSELLVMVETPVQGDQARLKQKKDQIKEKLLGKKPTVNDDKSLDMYLDSALVSIKKVKVIERLSQLAVQKPELADKLNQANLEIEELQKAVDEKKITSEEAMKRFDEILKNAVEDSGDEGLKKMLEEQRKDEEKQREKEKEFEQGGESSYSETSYETREEAERDVYSTLSDAGISIYVNPKTGLTEATMPDANGDFKFSVRVEENNGKFVCMMEDKYANKGETGPYDAKELLRAADQRHIDAYLSYKLRLLVKAPDNANDVKDEELIKVGEKIIGGGEVRQYRIDGDYMRGLDGLAKLLAAKDDKRPTLEKRVYEFGLYLDRFDVDGCRNLMNKLKDPNLDERIKKEDLNVSQAMMGKL
jgi:hypothetical protein